MDSETLRRHCPSAKFVSKVEIPNWEVQFNHMSKTYGAGVTGVEPAAGKVARGVLYDVPVKELEHLDTIEGVPQGVYYRQKVIVVDEYGNMFEAETYRTSKPSGPNETSRRYLGLMLKGAKEHILDQDYFENLKCYTNPL